MRLEERGCRRSGRHLHSHRHPRDSQPLRDAHRAGSRRSECRVHFIFRFQRADAGIARTRVPRRLQPVGLDRDLGDLPINTLAVDGARGDIYAGTDFGPLVLKSGASTWELAGIGFPEALMVDLKFMPSQRLLVAATHGLGIFYLRLDP